MQDYRDMGDKFEVRMGMKEVAFLLVAFFIMVGLAFSLGVVMGKKLFGPVPGTAVTITEPGSETPPTPSTSPIAEPPNVMTRPTPTATGDTIRFHEDLRNEPAMPTGSPEPSPGMTSAPRPEPINEPEPPPTAVSPSARPTPTPTAAPTASPTPSHTPTTPAPTAAPATGSWAIQIGAGSSKDGAEYTVKSLKGKGLDAWSVSVKNKDGSMYYRLYVGHYGSMDEASAEMTKLKADKKIPADSFVRKA